MVIQSKKKHLTKQLYKRSIIGKPPVVLSDAAKEQSLLNQLNAADETYYKYPTQANAEIAYNTETKYYKLTDRLAEIYGKTPFWEYIDQRKSGH
jgi:flagellar biosynthesis/type III secretory pathway chaperone